MFFELLATLFTKTTTAMVERFAALGSSLIGIVIKSSFKSDLCLASGIVSVVISWDPTGQLNFTVTACLIVPKFSPFIRSSLTFFAKAVMTGALVPVDVVVPPPLGVTVELLEDGAVARADLPRSSAKRRPIMGRSVEANNAIGKALLWGTPAAVSTTSANTNVLVLIRISFVLPPN